MWITTSEADTDSRLSVPGWSRVLNGPSLTMEVNTYPKKCQYPGSETVWYKNVRQMDFYSPLIPSGGLKAEPMVNAAYEELFEIRLGIATSNSMCLSLGKESCKSGRFFLVGIMILLELQVIGCTYNVTPCKLPSIKTICWTHMLSFQLSMLIAAVEGASMLLKLRAIMLLDVRGKGAAIVNSLFKHFSTYCYMSHCPAQM